MFTTSQQIIGSTASSGLTDHGIQTDFYFDSHAVPYTFGEDLREASAACLEAFAPSSIIIVLDDAVCERARSYADFWRKIAPVQMYPLAASEAEKSLDRMSDLMNWAVLQGADRRTVIVAMGGGMVGNVAGLAAHLLFRGLTLVHVPTTYMAAFDSVLSQKQAVNGCGTKNVFGAFHPPHAIFCDCLFLDDLPAREVRAGLAESVKNALIAEPEQADMLLQLPSDPSLFGVEEHQLIWRTSAQAKVPRLAEDCKEKGPALIFEYGHTLGHAIEASAHGQLRHGEAVALGLRAVARLAQARFDVDQQFADLHDTLLDHFELPRELPANIALSDIEARVRQDNKRGYIATSADQIAMVIAPAPGRALMTSGLPLVPVPVQAVMTACTTLADG